MTERRLLKPYEFWHPRVFEAPFYIYLGIQCLLNWVSPKNLTKANYALDHGEIGIGSKYVTQLAFNQDHFLPTDMFSGDLSLENKKNFILKFADMHGYPVILKPDMGCVGKGISKISSEQDLDQKLSLIIGDFIVQKFTGYTYECGIFYVRQQGNSKITGINEKHFPAVIGNGIDSIQTLAEQHRRFTHHWQSFLQYLDTTRVLAKGVELCLSFIGSHTMGCKFTDDTHLINPTLEQAVFRLFEDQLGFNFGRLDVKCASREAFLAGDFIAIEVNGVASLPTHMFDPKYNVFQAYKIFFKHGKYLVKIAREHKRKPMQLLSYWQVLQKAKANQSILNKVHGQLKS